MTSKPRNIMKSLRVKDSIIVGNTIKVENGIEADITGQVFGTVSTYATSGAIALTDTMAILDATTLALAMTLADGTAGQRIVIKCSNSTKACVTTPANLADGATLTCDAAKELTELIFDGTNWQIIINTSTLA
jgi:hypothetical protein